MVDSISLSSVTLENEELCIRFPETLRFLLVIRARKDLANEPFKFPAGKILLRNS